jgi:hypothetical protein
MRSRVVSGHLLEQLVRGVGGSESAVDCILFAAVARQLTSLWRVAIPFVDSQQLLLCFGVTRFLKKDMDVFRTASTTSYGVLLARYERIIISGSPAENCKEDAKIRN